MRNDLTGQTPSQDHYITNRPGDANPRLETALAYAGFGWRVIPLHTPLLDGGCTCGRTNCPAAGKHPRIAAWQRDASTDPEQIETWWKQWPEANVGLLMGQEAGLIAIDVDPRNGGTETLYKLTNEYEPLPATVTALTGGGGIHYLFAAPDRPVKKNNNGDTLGPGVDLQGEGSLIVVAPSRHKSGGAYTWASGCAPWERELAPLPAWVLALVDASQQRRASKAPSCATRATLPAVLPEGKRNDTLFRWACGLRARGLEEDEILARLIEENAARCKPPLPEADLRTIAHQAAKYEPGEAGQGEGRRGQRSVATVLVELAQEAELFATPDAEPTPYADVPADGHREVWQVRSSGFRRWLTARFFAATGGVPGTQAFEEALRTIEALAVAGDDRRPVHVRVAGHGGRVYLDLCDPSWRVVEIAPTGWRVLQRSPVAFRRTRGMLPLPEPERGGSIEDLRALANVRDDDGFRLVVAWLVMALHPGGPYPVLALHGEQGSAKSYTARVLRSIIDPNRAPLRAEPRSVQDLQIAANNSWVVALDNVSHLPAWLSDALCRVATGGGFATRALYTDGEEAIFDARRPTLMTGIEEVATRGDLQDRALVVELGRIDDADRLPERELDARVEALRPRVLGGLLDAAATALRRQDEVTPPPLARMADFVVWVHAAEPALPWSEGDFVATYARNRGAAVQTVLEADVISAHLRALAADGWSGTASELLAELERRADDATKRARGWPGSARALSGRLRRLAPALRRVGVCIEFTRRPHTGTRLVSLETVRTEPSPASPPSPECQKRSNSAIFGGDANGSSGDAKCGLRHPVASPEESSNGAGSPGVGDAGDAGDAKFATLSDSGESEVVL